MMARSEAQADKKGEEHRPKKLVAPDQYPSPSMYENRCPLARRLAY